MDSNLLKPCDLKIFEPYGVLWEVKEQIKFMDEVTPCRGNAYNMAIITIKRDLTKLFTITKTMEEKLNQMVFYGATMSEAVNKGYSWLDAFAPNWRETVQGEARSYKTSGMFIAKWKPSEETK